MDAKKKPGRRKIGKQTITFRFFPTTKRLLRKAARKAKKQISEYAEAAIQRQIREDGIE
jgi:uncharacterized protein (DUF1778 family)